MPTGEFKGRCISKIGRQELRTEEDKFNLRTAFHALTQSRPLFNKSTRFEDIRSFDDDRLPYRRPSSKKMKTKAAGLQSRDDDLDLADFSQGQKSGQFDSRRLTSRPEALPLDFVVRPQSKIDPEEIRARAKQDVHDQRRLKINKTLKQVKAQKKKPLQASKLSVEGRGMVKYL